jgi:predicted Fe-Mo cluster-binding NifX family protein
MKKGFWRIKMKIAVITDDGKTISRHFGRAQYYEVIEVENDEIVSREMREKMGHSHFAHNEEHHHNGGMGSGMDAASHSKHQAMFEAIRDCDVLICGGMGRGAYQSMKSLGIKPYVTQISSVDQAVESYLSGELKDQTDMLH